MRNPNPIQTLHSMINGSLFAEIHDTDHRMHIIDFLILSRFVCSSIFMYTRFFFYLFLSRHFPRLPWIFCFIAAIRIGIDSIRSNINICFFFAFYRSALQPSCLPVRSTKYASIEIEMLLVNSTVGQVFALFLTKNASITGKH